MRILLINSVCGTGSTGRIVTDLANDITKRGHTCSIAYGLGEERHIKDIETIKLSSIQGYYLSNFLSKISGITGKFNDIATRKLIRHIEVFKPDIIHLHNLHGYYINVFMLFKFLNISKIPIIWTLHDCWGYTGNCAHYSYINCSKWQDVCHKCPQIKEYPQSFFFDFTSQMFEWKKTFFLNAPIKVITTPSQWLCDEVKHSFLNKFTCVPVYNGIDTEQFRIKRSSFKKKNNFEKRKIILGVANAWSSKKGLYDFFRLADIIPEEYKIVLVGLSKKQIDELPSSIYGIQRTESVNQLVDIYNAADIFINPSYEETFGLVTAEALLCGVPVITYDKTAVPEVAEAPYGRIVTAGDIQGLLKAIICTPQYDRIAVRTSALKYSKSKMLGKYMELYEKAVES